MTRRSDYYIGRREFVAGAVSVIGAVMTAVVGLPIIGYLIAPALRDNGSAGWVPLGPVSSLQSGGPMPFSFSRLRQVGWKRAMVNRTVYASQDSAGNLTVLSDVCTHLSCKVHWDETQAAFVCPCHDAEFDARGHVVSGPPPRPLDRFEAKIENDQLLIYVEA